MFSRRCSELNIKLDFSNIKVASVGKKTSSLCAENNIPVHITPYKFTGRELARKLMGTNLEGKRFFIPRSAIGREDLLDELKEAGAAIVMEVVYDVGITSKEEVKDYIEELSKQKPDAFLFTSPSTFDNFVKIMELTNPAGYFEGSTVAAIGPTTKAVIEKNNVVVGVMPEEHTMESLADALVKNLAAK
jgi:uroporphyrinogen-III synthase